MQARNDSLLYSGGGGQTPAQRRKEKVETAKVKREERRNALLPHEEDVMALFDKEIEAAQLQMLSHISPTTPAKDTAAILAALNLHKDLVAKFKIKLQNAMRGKVTL